MLVPGVANALSARIVADLGFEAVYVTGAGVTNMDLGLPDLGFLSLPQLAEHTAAIRDAVTLPDILNLDSATHSTFITPYSSWNARAPTQFKSKTRLLQSDVAISRARI